MEFDFFILCDKFAMTLVILCYTTKEKKYYKVIKVNEKQFRLHWYILVYLMVFLRSICFVVLRVFFTKLVHNIFLFEHYEMGEIFLFFSFDELSEEMKK